MNTYKVTIGPDVTHLSLTDLDALREYYRARYPELVLTRQGPDAFWHMVVARAGGYLSVIGSVEQTSSKGAP